MVVVWGVSLSFHLEHFHWPALVGSLIVLAGILATGIKDKPLENEKRFTLFDRELIWPIAGAVFIAGYHLCYGEAMKNGAAPNSLYLTSISFSLPFMLYMSRVNFAARARAILTRAWGKLAFAAFACAFGFVIFLYGLRQSGPGYAITLRNTSIFFAIGMSFFIKERMTRFQIIGASIVGFGAVVLGLGG